MAKIARHPCYTTLLNKLKPKLAFASEYDATTYLAWREHEGSKVACKLGVYLCPVCDYYHTGRPRSIRTNPPGMGQYIAQLWYYYLIRAEMPMEEDYGNEGYWTETSQIEDQSQASLYTGPVTTAAECSEYLARSEYDYAS